MTIDEEGFLSPEIDRWIKKHRAANRAWFALATDLNRIAHLQLSLVSVSGDDNQAFLTALLFMRGLSGFQGAILMAERGMTQEALTLTRGCFETVFYLGALRKDPAFADALISDDASRRKKLANALLRLPEEPSGLEPDHTAKLEKFLDRLDKAGTTIESLNIERVARLADMSGIYDTYYRGLSNDAAHPSVTSLNRHVKADAKGVIQGLHWGPDVPDVEDTLKAAVTAAVYLIFKAKEMLNRDDIGAGLDRCWEQYKRLIDEKAKNTP